MKSCQEPPEVGEFPKLQLSIQSSSTATSNEIYEYIEATTREGFSEAFEEKKQRSFHGKPHGRF